MQAKTGSTENHKRYSNVNTLYHIASGLFWNMKFSYNYTSRSPANIPLVVEKVDTNDYDSFWGEWFYCVQEMIDS